MKRETLFLKLAVCVIGLPVLAFCIYGIYSLIIDPINPKYANILYPIVAGIYSSAVPYYIALYKAFKLLNYIDKNTAFSELSVKALKSIKYCAAAISAIYVIILPFIYLVAEMDDAPGLIVIGMTIGFASMIITVFAALLQKLLKNAIEIKSENDLTV